MCSQVVRVESLSHLYGNRQALDNVSFQVHRDEIFAFLGPNGGGKTTLFRVLSTLTPPQAGHVQVLGHDVTSDLSEVRRQLGVVFQSPSLDKKLTVNENLSHQAALYGLFGDDYRKSRREVLHQLGIEDRQSDLVETLSGGLQRRVDLAKSLLHRPSVLLLDEPSTGLDPGARSDLWRYLRELRDAHSMTIVLTTHLLEEADRADRVAILHEGRIVAMGTPSELRESLGGDAVTVESDAPEELSQRLNERWKCDAQVVDRDVRFPRPDDSSWWQSLRDEYPTLVKSIKLGKPTLEDVFIQRTGHRFWQDAETDGSNSRSKKKQARSS